MLSATLLSTCNHVPCPPVNNVVEVTHDFNRSYKKVAVLNVVCRLLELERGAISILLL